MQLVKSTPGFENWNPNYSAESLSMLGDWFTEKIKKNGVTQDKTGKIENTIDNLVETTSCDFTDETRSLAVYVGMYYGQVMLENNSALKWEQQLGNKNLADFGQPVVTGLGVIPINPVRVVNSIASGILNETKTGKQLRQSYDYWRKLRIPK
jgi:hypothetical protein